MNAALGTGGVLLGLAASLGGIVTLAVALRQRKPQMLVLGRSYVLLCLLGIVVAVAAMERALITRDFTVQYVAENGSSTTPALFNVATLWAALEGSILLWALVLCGYMAVVVRRFRDRLTDPLVGWALLTMLVVSAFFFFLLAGPANPFQSFDPSPGYDGPGPNPLLQNHVLMAFHPPMLYLGYVGFTVPFAFAVAALVTGRVGEGWLIETRRWTLFTDRCRRSDRPRRPPTGPRSPPRTARRASPGSRRSGTRRRRSTSVPRARRACRPRTARADRPRGARQGGRR